MEEHNCGDADDSEFRVEHVKPIGIDGANPEVGEQNRNRIETLRHFGAHRTRLGVEQNDGAVASFRALGVVAAWRQQVDNILHRVGH